MFSTFKLRILLGIYIFIILSIPVGAYLASQNQTYKSKASETTTKVVKSSPSPTPSSKLPPAKQLLSLSEANLPSEDTADLAPSSPSPQPSSPTIATSFGPTLSLKATLEGRPKDNQATKLFVGIVEGILSANPKFLLSFSVNLPANGAYSNLSLAGLTSGSKYTALLKGSTQIATSSAFIMSPTVANLNNGEAINLLTGDLNEDNVVNSSDYTIVQKALGTNSKSPGWNDALDFNKDGLVNTFDLAIVFKNLGQIGASGAWTSPLPKVATPSAGLATGGHWLWIPK